MKSLRMLLAALAIAAGAPATAQTDIAGTWAGMLPAGPGTTLEIHFALTREGDGYAAVLSSPTPGAIPITPATSTSFTDNRLVLAVDALSGRYEGVLENGKFAGNWIQQGTAIPLELVPYVERVLSDEAKAALRGSWVGDLVVAQANLTLAIVLRFEDNAAGEFVGFLDSPDQGANGIPLANISFADGALSVVIPQISGDYKGTLSGDSLTGTFTQLGQGTPLNLARGEYRPRGLTLSQEAIDRLEGSWVGRVQNAAGGSLAIVFRFESNDAGNLVAFLDSPEQGASGIPIGELTLEGDQLSFVIPAARASFRATLAADGMTGTWAQGNMSQPVTMARGEYTPTAAPLTISAEAFARIAGTWRGPMGPLELVFRFETGAGGDRFAFLDIPAQGATGLVVAEVVLEGDTLTLRMPAVGVTVSGTLAAGGFTGQWQQGQANNPVTLTRQP